jgi:hypothetical protein
MQEQALNAKLEGTEEEHGGISDLGFRISDL